MKITALLSTYNNEKVIKETIDSVLMQSYQEFEFVIINDGSTDKTKDIIETYKDTRIKLVNLPKNVGIGNALNKGLAYCTGDYIIKVDGDDIQNQYRFEKQLHFMECNPQLAMSKTSIAYFADDKEVEASQRFQYRTQYLEDLKNRNKTPEEIKESLAWHCSITHGSMIIKSSVLKELKYRDFHLFEDYDLFIRMVEKGYLIGHLDEKLVKVRVSDSSITATTKDEVYFDIAYQIKEKIVSNFKQNENIYMWGTGGYAKKLSVFLNSKGWEIEGYIDSFNFGDTVTFEDKKVYSPEFLKYNKVKIIIAASTGIYDIIKYLKTLGYETNRDFFVLK